MSRLPNAAHATRAWRVHEIVGEFRLEDVWALPTPGGPEEFGRLVQLMASMDPDRDASGVARALWSIRWRLGKLLGWDDEETGIGTRVATLRERLPRDLQDGPSGPEFLALPFTSLYLTDEEWAAEVANRTVHGVMHVGWVSDGGGVHRGQMAVYVKPDGLLGKAYMTVIRPFRYWLVYPPMLRVIEREWLRVVGKEFGGGDKRLPPGQLEIAGFPRFGVPGPPPMVPSDPELEISGAVTSPVTLPVTDLADLPRREVIADFHCVAGWTATDLHWEGVAFSDFYAAVIEPYVARGTTITHVVFEGLDGYRSIVTIEDALGAVLADHLDGRALGMDHGAPLRVVSPQQYGFVSTKHLCRVEVHTTRPHERYHPHPRIQFGLGLLKPHERARVWLEERHRYLPAQMVRPVYRRLIGPLRRMNARS